MAAKLAQMKAEREKQDAAWTTYTCACFAGAAIDSFPKGS
jgi:hypothetical protein